MTNTLTNSKQGRVLDTDGCPGLPAAGRVFGESPIKRPLTGKHPPSPARADASETDNLKNAAAPTAPTR